jgi:hypothetical protein
MANFEQTQIHLQVYEALDKVFHFILDVAGEETVDIARAFQKDNSSPPYLRISTPNRKQIGQVSALDITDIAATSQEVVNDFSGLVTLYDVGDADYIGRILDRLEDQSVSDMLTEYGISIYEVGDVVDSPSSNVANFVQERICELGIGFASQHTRTASAAQEVTMSGTLDGTNDQNVSISVGVPNE